MFYEQDSTYISAVETGPVSSLSPGRRKQWQKDNMHCDSPLSPTRYGFYAKWCQ